YDQVHVFYKDQKKMKEWQWRDRFDPARDNHRVRVEAVSGIEVEEVEEKVMLRVKLKNSQCGDRNERFYFQKASEKFSLSSEE
ncbi:MAG: hypothetical protein R6V40_04865, partial [Candidatus Moraniibacteriota bacterium]